MENSINLFKNKFTYFSAAYTNQMVYENHKVLKNRSKQLKFLAYDLGLCICPVD